MERLEFAPVVLAAAILGAAGASAQTETPSRQEQAPQAPAQASSREATNEEVERKGCPAVDVDYDADTDKDSHPTPEVPADKSLVYVLRPTMLGHKIQSKLAVDGHWVGVNRGRNYFFVVLEPGEHFLCSKAENTSVLALRTEAGRTYFVEQKIKMGFLKARNKLALMSDKEGLAELASCHPSVWRREDD